jgi:FAD/FMN-containing dehydrogenase
MLAANTGGARLIRYGDVRHNTLGLQALLMQPPGELLEMGNRLHKNNTGPDWKQLFIGTAGSYGIVTQAVLRAHPLPRQRATAWSCRPRWKPVCACCRMPRRSSPTSSRPSKASRAMRWPPSCATCRR